MKLAGKVLPFTESELNVLKPKDRDLLGGSNTDLSRLGDQPLKPSESVDENYIDYSDPFDTSIVESVRLPGQTELKFLERELLGELEVSRPRDWDDDFDPRAEESSKIDQLSQSRKVSFDLPLTSVPRDEKVSKPLTPYYVRSSSIHDEDDFAKPFVATTFSKGNNEQLNLLANDTQVHVKVLTPIGELTDEASNLCSDPFDTSIANNILPGETQLKHLESEFIQRQALQQNLPHSAIGSEIETVSTWNVFGANTAVDVKPLIPLPNSEDTFGISDDADPFDTSIASNIAPGRTELKLLESELI